MSPHISSSPSAGRRKLRILYADDVRELRDVARLSFSRDGHEIECVEDGQLAFERLVSRSFSCDLLITDHHMPRLNGLQLVTQVRATAFAGRILVFSSELDPLVAQAYRRLGVDRVLQKPVFPSDLRRILGELFPPDSCVSESSRHPDAGSRIPTAP